MTMSNTAVQNDTQANQNSGSANQDKNNEYINHYLSGNPIIYIYKITEFVDRDTGAITWFYNGNIKTCLLYTSPSPRDQRGSRMPSSA